MEHITADVTAVDDVSLEMKLTKLKKMYDSGLISEASYYRHQCELFEELQMTRSTEYLQTSFESGELWDELQVPL